MGIFLVAWGVILAVFILFAILFRFQHTTTKGGMAGWFVGFVFGLTTNFLFGFMHFAGPIDIPNPVINFPGWSTTLGDFYPLIGSQLGIIVGAFVGSFKRDERDRTT
jgi:hypothetical protein